MKRRPPKDAPRVKIKNTLVIDGNALFKVGYHGAKSDYNRDGQHIGGIYQFIAVLRRLLQENLYHQVYAFWDGKFSGRLRYDIYPNYKIDRGKDFINGTVPDEPDQIIERYKVQEYLEDLFIRQIRHEDIVEGDDFIAYYCLNKAPNEKITIATIDGDLCQLINEDVQVYLITKKAYVTHYNFQQFFEHHPDNHLLMKIICGDDSDSIRGVKGVKEKTLLDLFPILKERAVSLQEILELANKQQTERLDSKKKPLKSLTNIIEGITSNKNDKADIQLGMALYERNERLINLSKPMMTDEAIDRLNTLMGNKLDESDRGIKEAYARLKKDGLESKIGNFGIEYLLPFKELINREKGLIK